jgi:hypothetical protein
LFQVESPERSFIQPGSRRGSSDFKSKYFGTLKYRETKKS